MLLNSVIAVHYFIFFVGMWQSVADEWYLNLFELREIICDISKQTQLISKAANICF